MLILQPIYICQLDSKMFIVIFFLMRKEITHVKNKVVQRHSEVEQRTSDTLTGNVATLKRVCF